MTHDLKKRAELSVAQPGQGNGSQGADEHPEQDPAEGSREIVERELARRDKVSDRKAGDDAQPSPAVSSPGSEAAEPSPEN